MGERQKIGISWDPARRTATYGRKSIVVGLWHRPSEAADIESEIKHRMRRCRSYGLEYFDIPIEIMLAFTESVIAWFDYPRQATLDRMIEAEKLLAPYMRPPKPRWKKKVPAKRKR
jgi:hypothetical protein